MTFYLTLDTSDRSAVGVAEHTPDGSFVESAWYESPDSRHHAENLTPMVARALAEAGIERPDAIVVGTGPGAFTGLRAGLMTARMLARAWEVKLYGLSSLEILAADGAPDEGEVLVLVDARRKELFALRARRSGADGGLNVLDGPRIMRPEGIADEVAQRPASLVVAREGLYPELLGDARLAAAKPVPIVRLLSAKMAAGETDFGTEPVYLRRPDIHGAAAATA